MFDELTDRRGTSCLKWDGERRITGREGLLPFWVADMDFKTAPAVMDALRRRMDHGIFGYTSRPDSLIDALVLWFGRRHRWSIAPDSVLEIPGVVPFLHILVRNFTEAGEAVLIQEPVYYPFRQALERNRRVAAVNPLVSGPEGRWRMDLDNLARVADETGAKMLIFCSPHNPVGRVWSMEELTDLADLCFSRGITVVSDEIHADLVQPGNRHVPWLTLGAERLPRSMALLAPTKSFNLPGLVTAFAAVPDKSFRDEVFSGLEASGFGGGSSAPLSYVAAEAAWREGESWLDQLLEYVGDNYGRLLEFLERELPEAEVAALEGTYLAWINLAGLRFSDRDLWTRLLDGGIWPSRGTQFGAGGEGHIRMNLACPRARLEQGLAMMGKALR